jgi:RNA polymerase sigma factor (sigma-70 family)
VENGLEQWFKREILPLEPMLERYLRRNWRDQSEVQDIRQDVYVRIYGSAGRERPLNAKCFLFQVARNLMIDRLRRKNVVVFDSFADFEAMDLAEELPDLESSMAAQQEVSVLQDALTKLPPRCREIITLRKIEGLSQRDVAKKMGITEDTVESQVARGMRLLAKSLHGGRALLVSGVRRRTGRLGVLAK